MATEQEQIEKAALEYANQIVLEAQDSPEYFAFINGVEWQKEQQAANDAIEFAIWTHQNLWACLNNEPMWYNKNRVYQYKTECLTTQQLYELWQESKNK